MPFWTLKHVDTLDRLNETIWRESLTIQSAIQPYRADWQDGEIGAQQAMRAPRQLRWVPDLVGNHWRSKEALIVVGSAYGPFITNSHGCHEIAPDDYDQPTAGAFQKVFLEGVVTGGREYYTKIARVAERVVPDAAHLVLFDLCRVSFVQRGTPRDVGNDGVVKKDLALFTRYVETPLPRSWLWKRLVDTEASAVVALGTIAEHGLLRLFAAQLREVTIADSLDRSITFTVSNSKRWPANYANTRRTISGRSEERSVPYWLVTGLTEAGRRRSWRVAVVPHPGAFGERPEYTRRAVQTVFSEASHGADP